VIILIGRLDWRTIDDVHNHTDATDSFRSIGIAGSIPLHALLIEVAETTLDQDRGKKLAAYARGGIPVYWIVNLVDRQVEVYTGPRSDGYANGVDFTTGLNVPVVVDGIEIGQIAVSDILT
jgi:Putative restriction endonuclease